MCRFKWPYLQHSPDIVQRSHLLLIAAITFSFILKFGVVTASAQVKLPALAPLLASPQSSPEVQQSTAAVTAPRDSEIRGVWIHTYEAWDWDATMRKIAAAGFNCVFVRVARGVNAIYPSQYLPRDGWAEDANLDEMRTAIDAAHNYGLQFHAWKVNFNSAAGLRTGPLVARFYNEMAQQDRLVRDPQGKQAASLNPADPRNQELEYNVMLEIATKYNVDGIHFDYIRYPDSPHFDFDYGEVSRREFEKVLDQRVEHWPDDVINGPLKIRYEDWERDNINSLVQRVYSAVKKVKPEVQVSAAVWRAHRKYRAAIKQDWLQWVQEGWLDFVVPMDYQTNHDEFGQTVRAQVANTAGKVPIAAGIGSYQQKTPEDVLHQIEIARREGADGYVLFDYKREGMDALLDALAKGPQAQAAYPAYQSARGQSLFITREDYIRHHMAMLNPREIDFKGAPAPLVERKDDVPACVIGGRALAFMDMTLLNPTAAKSLSLNLYLEDMAGNVLQTLSSAQLPESVIKKKDWEQNPEYFSEWFTVLAGRSRIVLRGTVQTRDKPQSFLLRGSIIEGLPAEQIAQLQAHEKPPKPVGPGRRIAIYAGGMASTGLLKALQGTPGLNAYPIYRLKPDHWQSAQVLILPQLNDVAELTPDVMEALSNWVEGGGVLLLTHDAVGFRWHPRLFPEIGQGVALSTQRKMQVTATASIFEHAYSDHVALQPAPGATVLATEMNEAQDKSGTPVVITGNFGKGKVIMNGALLGYAPDGGMPEGERKLLLDLVSAP